MGRRRKGGGLQAPAQDSGRGECVSEEMEIWTTAREGEGSTRTEVALSCQVEDGKPDGSATGELRDGGASRAARRALPSGG